ncbi:MAG: hypothetical protein EOP47_13410 [Sphingobacteriaceae bacterium]|nr:MAG: hypothetical protein EOP47_13410 [Sphingobacteriaceae bacterium]
MRRIFYLLIIACFLSVHASAQLTYTFEHYSMGGPHSAAFTSNNFKCIAVGKNNRIWAGTQHGGLYMYDQSYNIWQKSDKLTNVFINDIKSDPDSGIWIAQSGQQTVGGNSNIAGGVNYFPGASDILMEFYSVQGTTSNAYMISRNVKSLYVDPRNKAADSVLPRVWAVSGTYITSYNTRRGGVNIGLNKYAPYFTTINGGFDLVQTATPICEAVGGNANEVWVATRQNQGGSQILRYRPDGSFIKYINPTNTPVFSTGFAAQAILFDSHGNRWVGLKSGGIRVNRGNQWFTMYSPAWFDVNTQVNFNAMVEDEFGNVYIGTSAGMLMYNSPYYNPMSSPDNPNSYEYFNIADGLLDNNVTGLAYDKKNGKILITSPSGVSFMKIRQPHIKGVVYNVFTNVDSTNNPYPGLQRQPFRTTQDVRAYLIKDGEEKEMVYPDAEGVFELKEANETDPYTVEVKYNREGKTMRFVYNNIRNHSLLKPVLVPDSLIGEVKSMKDKLENRCFPVKLYFNYEIPELFCTNRLRSGPTFNTSSLEAPFQEFYNPAGLTTDIEKRINNLANYYASLAALHKIGGQASELVIDGTSGLLDLLEGLVGTVKFYKEMKKPGNADAAAQMDEDVKSGLIAMATAIKDATNFTLLKASKYLITDPDTKKVFENCVSALTEIADLVLAGLSDGATSGTLMKALIDNAKKLIAIQTAIYYYKNVYAQSRHSNFIANASSHAAALQSQLTYEEGYDKLYHPENNSLVQRATESHKTYKDVIELLADAAKCTDIATGFANATSILVVIPPLAPIAATAKQISFALQAAKLGIVGASSITGYVGAMEVAKKSDSILINSSLQRQINGTSINSSGLSAGSARYSVDSLTARKIRYNLRLSEIQPIYTGSFNATAYKAKRKQVLLEDSLFTAELRSAVNALIAVGDSANKHIPVFKKRMDRVLDTLVAEQTTYNQSYFFENLAYIYHPDKTTYAGSIDSLINKIKLMNDSCVIAVTGLLQQVADANLDAQAFLVQEKYGISFSRVPGSTGSVTYTFKNYGETAMNNVSFKMKNLTAGYLVQSADSVNVGSIAAGQSKQVSFNFKAPLHDSIGTYRIEVKAANGQFNDATGSFYVIDPSKCYTAKDGNWNDPSTWECGVVPNATKSVVIGHQVTITANAACKKATMYNEGKITVQAGIQFNIIP